MTAPMADLPPGVRLIDLHFQDVPGAIAAYVLVGGGEAALIETGPATTRGTLLRGLAAEGVDPAAVRDIVVTHIHLDHSGAAGVLLRDDFPNARIHVHPLGQAHLIDPSRLIRSAARLYGDRMQQLWGEVAPIAADRVVALRDGGRLHLAGHEVETLFTPGHASHHVALRHRASGAVFAGDVAGVRVPHATVINAPTVPPEFDPVAWDGSIKRMTSLDPGTLLLTHFGAYADVSGHLRSLQQQLHRWVAQIREALGEGQSPAEIALALRAHDERVPGTGPSGAERIDLIAAYAISVAGVIRYIERFEH